MDRKLETFLTLCRTMNYRQTAERMHLTQPAITKQIQALEDEYGVKLFNYDGHKLSKSDKCQLLESYAISLEYNYKELMTKMREKQKSKLRVGATRTIGDYAVSDRIITYLKHPDNELSFTVDNTNSLLAMLDENKLDFALVEGAFDKSKYAYKLYRNEPFFGICNKKRFAKKDRLEIKDLFDETLIVREKGSGTRNLFEEDLKNMGYSIDSFSRVIELNSFKLIRQAVREGIGISFAYASVISQDKDLTNFKVKGIMENHEFNVVCLPNTSAMGLAEQF